MITISIITIILATLFAAFLYLGGRQIMGGFLVKAFPKCYLKIGDPINIFINDEYNRTATITAIHPDSIEIYDSVRLVIEHRCRFYAIANDNGNRIIYISANHSNNYKYIKAAEFVRKSFKLIDDCNMLSVEEVSKKEG